MHRIEGTAQPRRCEREQIRGDLDARGRDNVDLACREACLERPHLGLARACTFAPVDFGHRDLGTAARELLLEEFPTLCSLDEQNALARHGVELGVTQQTFRIGALARLHRHAVTGLIERAGGGRTDRGERQVAALLEQRRTVPDGVRAREDDETELLQSAEPRRPVATFVDGLDLDGGEALDACTLRLEQAAQHSGLMSWSSDEDAGALQWKHAIRRCATAPAIRGRPT